MAVRARHERAAVFARVALEAAGTDVHGMELLQDVRPGPEEAGAFRTAQPLVAIRGEEVAAELLDVDVNSGKDLGAVDQAVGTMLSGQRGRCRAPAGECRAPTSPSSSQSAASVG